MQIRKRCVQCNTLNDPDRFYCVNCGKYLKGTVAEEKTRFTIWGTDDSPVRPAPDKILSAAAVNVQTRQIVICPECSVECDAAGGVLPLSCPECGYFFQAGIDRIINTSDRADTNHKVTADPGSGRNSGTNSNQVNSSAGNTSTGRGPLPRAGRDSSSLRIISLSSDHLLPEMMKETGSIIGKNGTAFRAFKSKQQVSIWHTDTGWYVRAIFGTPLFNGVPMNQGASIKLSAGDKLDIDEEQFMAEIIK